MPIHYLLSFKQCKSLAASFFSISVVAPLIFFGTGGDFDSPPSPLGTWPKLAVAPVRIVGCSSVGCYIREYFYKKHNKS